MACPFCNPGESDLFSDMSEAQAVVLINKVATRKYKIIESLKGNAKLGRVIVAAEPQGKLGKKGRLLLSTAGPPNLPYWSDAPRVLNPEELQFARQAIALEKKSKKVQWDFVAQNLQHKSSEIANAAYNTLAGVPLAEVQKRYKIPGKQRLLAWAKDPKIKPEKRALYLLMVSPQLDHTHKSWISKRLFSSSLPTNSSLIGPLTVAYLQTAGHSGLPKIEERFYSSELPAGRITPLNRALTLAYEQSEELTLKSEIRKLFARELKSQQRGAFVLAPLAIWQDYSVAGRVEKLFQLNADLVWVKVAVIRYFRSFQNPQALATLQRLSLQEPSLVQRTTDGYKRSDLGID